MSLIPTRENEVFIKMYIFFALVSRQSAALSSATQHTIPKKFGGKWGTEYLNTKFPLLTMMCDDIRCILHTADKNSNIFKFPIPARARYIFLN